MGFVGLLVAPGFEDCEPVRPPDFLEQVEALIAALLAARLGVLAADLYALPGRRWGNVEIGHDIDGAVHGLLRIDGPHHRENEGGHAQDDFSKVHGSTLPFAQASSNTQCSAAKETATAAPSSNISVGGRRTVSWPAGQSTMYWMKSPWNRRWRILPAAVLEAPFGGPSAKSI